MARREKFVESVCEFEHELRLLFVFCVVFLALTLVYLVAADPGTAAYSVSLLNLPGLGFFLLFSGYFLRRCETRR